MRAIRRMLDGCVRTRRELGNALGISSAAVSQMLNHAILPKTRWPEIRKAIVDMALGHGRTLEEIEAALKELEQTPAKTAQEEVEPMILRKQTLSMQARKVFCLAKNPFSDPETSAEVYMSPDTRFIRESMFQAAVGGGFFAIVGESGSGKSTLKEELITRINTESLPVIVIEPYTLAMAASESQGKPLRSGHIAEAIISTIQPGAKIPTSPEMRFRRLHEILKASHTAGMRHCLIIEEAHDLHRHTLKSLKRFHELKDGLARLLSIILIGQTELDRKLQVTDASVREVVQRCEVHHLPAIADPGDYIRHRFERAGVDCSKCFSADGLEELRTNLTVSPDSKGEGVYMGYPLMIANLATAAMNLAASVGERQVTADVVRSVR